MGLTLEDVGPYTLGELGSFTLKELSSMSRDDLVNAVREKYTEVSQECNQNTQLHEELISEFKEIKEICNRIEQKKNDPLIKTITIGIAVNAISKLIDYAVEFVVEHQTEIQCALAKAYLLLNQILQTYTQQINNYPPQ